MADDRLERLKKRAAEAPQDTFARYGLAMEYANRGESGAALDAFRTLAEAHPDYLPTYYQLGRLLARLGETVEARAVFTRGIAVAEKAGNQHTAGELEDALDAL